MAFTKNQETKIYWDEQGQGEPVLMIMGFTYPSYMWHRTRPLLSTRFRTVAFDNRGIGQSEVPPGPYPIPLMASDAAAVLDAAGIESAHVLGFSMGGMIAQEFAMQYPRRIRSLILAATHAGGQEAVREPAALEILKAVDLTPAQAAEAIRPFIYDPGTPQRLIDEDIAIRMKWLPTPAGRLAQLQGIMMWGSYSRISQIMVPTLVIHGEEDKLVPPENGKMLAERIPGAKLVMLPHASHIFTTDQTEAAHRAIIEFLLAQTGGHLGQAAAIQTNY
jgi:pimeloyl-ACP methyl ester carboxylesterase